MQKRQNVKHYKRFGHSPPSVWKPLNSRDRSFENNGNSAVYTKWKTLFRPSGCIVPSLKIISISNCFRLKLAPEHLLRPLIVQQISEKKCAFYDKRMKLGTLVKHLHPSIFGYRAISDWSHDQCDVTSKLGAWPHIFYQSFSKNFNEFIQTVYLITPYLLLLGSKAVWTPLSVVMTLIYVTMATLWPPFWPSKNFNEFVQTVYLITPHLLLIGSKAVWTPLSVVMTLISVIMAQHPGLHYGLHFDKMKMFLMEYPENAVMKSQTNSLKIFFSTCWWKADRYRDLL